MAILAVSIATAGGFYGADNDFTAVGRHLESFFPFDEQAINWNRPIFPFAFENAAPERMHMIQVFGIYEDSAFSLVFPLNEIDQLKSRSAVEFADRTNMQISITLSVPDLKIGAHVLFLLSLDVTQDKIPVPIYPRSQFPEV